MATYIYFDYDYFKKRHDDAQRAYQLRRAVVLESSDLSPDAKERLLAKLRDQYAFEMRTTREMMKPELDQANEALRVARGTTTRRRLEALYELAEQHGPAAVQVASRLVELNKPAQLLDLYRTGDPLVKGVIALAAGRYADEGDVTAGVLRSEVESDARADLAQAEELVNKANQLLKDVDAPADAYISRIAGMIGQDTGRVTLSSQFAAEELDAARREIPKMLAKA